MKILSSNKRRLRSTDIDSLSIEMKRFGHIAKCKFKGFKSFCFVEIYENYANFNKIINDYLIHCISSIKRNGNLSKKRVVEIFKKEKRDSRKIEKLFSETIAVGVKEFKFFSEWVNYEANITSPSFDINSFKKDVIKILETSLIKFDRSFYKLISVTIKEFNSKKKLNQ